MKKIAVAITGASGSIYAKGLLQKLSLLKDQVQEVSVVMSNNAKYVWNTEIGDESYNSFPFRYFDKSDFYSTLRFRISTVRCLDNCSLFHGYFGPDRFRYLQRPYYPGCRCNAEGTKEADLRHKGHTL
jgi:hypothetical protein